MDLKLTTSLSCSVNSFNKLKYRMIRCCRRSFDRKENRKGEKMKKNLLFLPKSVEICRGDLIDGLKRKRYH
ncbi:hypothetical protein [Niallia taxi]|uniref:hypothetical protein n=1 Tax=Niallia taxi TaxID=2499688 RepID=UPI001642FE3B|nr:hypothetical protein [Niallia taxi]MED3964973.1 hypothetical protein [Niallia taxi]